MQTRHFAVSGTCLDAVCSILVLVAMKLIFATATASALLVGLIILRPWGPRPADPARAPAAVCQDGTTSSSKHRSGTCSWHGGVLAFEHEPPRPVAVEQGDAIVRDAADAERRACAAMPSDEPWSACAAR